MSDAPRNDAGPAGAENPYSSPGEPPPAPRTGSLLVIFLTVFIDLLGFGIVLPLLPIYGKHFAEQHQLSAHQMGWLIGLLMSSFSAMQFLFLPIWGRLSDRYGRRPILMIGLAASTFFYFLFGLAAVWHSLAGLFIARIGAGIAGATISTAQAYIADTTARESRAKGMALIGAAFALGFTLGPLLGATALVAGGKVALSPWPGYVASALSGMALLLAIFKLPESWRPGSRAAERSLFDRSALSAALSTPSIALLLLTSSVAVFSFANFESTLSLQIEQIVEQRGEGEAPSAILNGLVRKIQGWGYEDQDDVVQIVVLCAFAYLGIVLTLAQGFLVRRLAGRMSEGTMAILGAAGAILGFVLLAFAADQGGFTQLLWAMALEVTGFAFVNPSLQALISRRSDPAQQGGILGLGQSATSLARILGPVCGLRLFTQSPAAPYWAAAGMMVVGLSMIVVSVRAGGDFVAADE
ncbi:MAG TPA: MFS transporter [Pirellulales bacterium]|nr:MFS transporter [Pirellulales bacterium]